MGLILLLAFIGIPILEITVIIKVGGLIGAWPTVGLIFATAVAGSALVRAQGFHILTRAQQTLDSGQFPAEELFDGMSLLVAGLLLLTPGFVTDAFGLVLLVPPFRRVIAGWVWRALLRSPNVHFSGTWGHTERHGDVIEGEFTEVHPERDDPRLPRR